MSELLDYQTVAVTEDIIAFISAESRTGIVSGNSVAIAGEDCVLVVDSGHFPSLTKRMISEIQQSYRKPVRYLVNTHWHPDHWTGNHLYRQAYPDVAIFSHPFTRDYIENRQENYAREALARAPAIRKNLGESMTRGTRSDGTVLNEDDKQFLKEQIIAIDAFIPELELMRLEPPTITFQTAIEVNLGERIARIEHFGRGNTAGDMTVFVPDTRTLVSGDLVVHPTPYSFGSYLSE